MIRPISSAYVSLVKSVALGMSREDGEEMARGLYCIRPHERFTTHILGSAWLCYAVMLAWFWAPIALDLLLEQSPAPFQVWDYECTLAEDATRNALSVWKVCARNLGMVRGLTRRAQDTTTAEGVPDYSVWIGLAASVLIGVLVYAAWHPPLSAGISTAAFVPFYLIGGGAGSADINAGSSIGAAQAAPTTGGSWVNATNTFVATGGTPFGTTLVGDYVSIYADGATVTTYVAQVTTVVSNVSVILSATIKYGTAPTDGASNRSAVAGGSWSTEQVLAAGGVASTTVPQSTKINIKQATYTGAASRTISLAGATTTPLWFSGYNTTPGDLDADTTGALTKPVFAFNATFGFTWSGAQQAWSSISVTGAISAAVVSLTGTGVVGVRLRMDNTSGNSAARAAANGAAQAKITYSWFRSPTTSTSNGVFNATTSAFVLGCVAENGGLAGFNATMCFTCISVNCAAAGFLGATFLQLHGCTTFNATTDGVKVSGTPASISWVSSHLIVGSNGGTATTNGINNASGTNTNLIFRAGNDYYNVTNPEVGMGDSFAFFPQTDSAFPLTSSTDMTPTITANAYKNGFPKVFEGGGTLGSQTNGGLSVGAVQPTPTSSVVMIDIQSPTITQPRQVVGY